MRRAMIGAALVVGLSVAVVWAAYHRALRIDATSEAAFERTYKALVAVEPQPRQDAINAALARILAPRVVKQALTLQSAPFDELTKPVDGLNADEILALAETMPPLPPDVAAKGDAARAQAAAK